MATKYFSSMEFGKWWNSMDPDILAKLDLFRKGWGYPVMVSPAEGGLGRHLGSTEESMHNIDKWGVVRAVDIFPKVPDGHGGFRYMRRLDDRIRAFNVAKEAGFTGIGLYTDTTPGNMVHVDNRDGSRVATWARIGKKYVGIDEVLR